MNSDNEGFLSVKEMAEKWPVGSEPERVWDRWIRQWKQEDLLYPSVHFRSLPVNGNGIRAFHYAERYLLRIAYNAGRKTHCTPLLCEFVTLHGAAVRALFLPPSPSDSQKSDNSQDSAR